MNLKHRLIAAIVGAGACAFAAAQTNIDDIVKTIVDNNPELINQLQMAEAQRLSDADGNMLSNPEVAFARVWGRKGIGNKLQLDVSQSFDWPGLYRARSLANRQSYTAAQMQTASDALNLAIEAKNMMFELIYVRQQLKYWQDLDEGMERMVAAADVALRDGEMNKLDHKKIAIEDYKVHAQINVLVGREQELISQIQALCPGVDLDLSGLTEYPLMPVSNLESYISQIAEVDPQLLAQTSAKEQARLEARAARMQRMPSFSVGYQHQAEMGDRFNGFTVGMSLPFFENRNARKAATAREEAIADMMESDEARIQERTRQTYAMLDVWKTAVDNYNLVFGDNDYLRLLGIAYKGGEINVLELLQETNYYDEMTMSYLEAKYNYNCSLAWLNRYSILQ